MPPALRRPAPRLRHLLRRQQPTRTASWPHDSDWHPARSPRHCLHRPPHRVPDPVTRPAPEELRRHPLSWLRLRQLSASHAMSWAYPGKPPGLGGADGARSRVQWDSPSLPCSADTASSAAVQAAAEPLASWIRTLPRISATCAGGDTMSGSGSSEVGSRRGRTGLSCRCCRWPTATRRNWRTWPRSTPHCSAWMWPRSPRSRPRPPRRGEGLGHWPAAAGRDRHPGRAARRSGRGTRVDLAEGRTVGQHRRGCAEGDRCDLPAAAGDHRCRPARHAPGG